ncbi:TIGR02186 family protein [Sphingomonas sp.]|uniref:TIGR02186 family protein n=1 Tax=Sphingomonas sp. TaxID=28214 RepID=UPI0025DB9EE2|nr:TIGR02186 family protein [Sphingomonas sp.]
MKRLFALLPLLLLVGAREPILVPDVSQNEVEIIYSFTGAELLLFGAIVYPGGRVPDGHTDVAVVLKGPPQSILVREKQKIGGLIWANADSARFRSAPTFYAIASSRPLQMLIDERTAAIYELGLGNVHLSPASSALPAEQRRFETGFVDLRGRSGLYVSHPSSVTIRQGVLYRARIAIPARVPVGRYTAETFLIRDGKVIAAATRDIDIRKSGFERFIATAATHWPFTYGMVAVLLSLAFGWAAGAIFRRI